MRARHTPPPAREDSRVHLLDVGAVAGQALHLCSFGFSHCRLGTRIALILVYTSEQLLCACLRRCNLRTSLDVPNIPTNEDTACLPPSQRRLRTSKTW